MAEVTEKATEAIAEAVETAGHVVADQAEGAAQVVRSINQIKIQYALLGAAFGAVAGAAVGWHIAYKKLETQFEQIAEDEITSMREYFQQREVAREGEARKPAVEELGARVEELGYKSPGDEVIAVPPPAEREEPSEEKRNIFRDVAPKVAREVREAPEWDYQKEIRDREGQEIYVIHKDEVGERDFTETTFTYYEGDDVVCDSDDKVISPPEEVIGNFAGLFGYGSEDPNVVYIRNEKIAADIEVCRSPNSYAEEVHGFTHSDRPRLQRRGQFDDD